MGGMGYDARQGQVGEGYDVATDALAAASRVLPVELRTYARGIVPSVVDEITGSEKKPSLQQSPIGGENFRRSEIGDINQVISRSMERLGRSDKGQVQYEDYQGLSGLSNSLGRFSWERLPDGNIRIFDVYDFANPERSSKAESLEKEKQDSGLALTVAKTMGERIKKEASRAVNNPVDFLTQPKKIFRNAMGDVGMIVAGNEAVAKNIDFIYNPKTYDTYHTPVDVLTKTRPRFGSFAEETKRTAKEKTKRAAEETKVVKK